MEGFAVLALSVYFYAQSESSWILFFVLLLAPDISMIGYFHNNKTGAVVYNVIHTYILPISVIFCGLFISSKIILAIGLIWVAHIGMDRMVGFGLKYPTNFKDNHLNQV